MKSLNDFKGKHFHFIGIGGVSMSGLAQLLVTSGAIVSGSDITSNAEISKLLDLGVKVYIGHSAYNVSGDIDIVVYTSAVTHDNVEIVRARLLGIKCMERAEFLGEVSHCYEKVIAVAGTHGKTTTTAILAEILNLAGLNPTIHIGGESIGLKGNTIIGGNTYLVVEACEYKESFKYLTPYIGIITSIEPDHLDYYKTMDNVVGAFSRFAGNSQNLVTLQDINVNHDNKITIFGDWSVRQIEFTYNGYNFNVFYKGEFYHTFRINMIGDHNITNSLFAIAVAHELGIEKETIERALANFCGVERRYETIYKLGSGCRVIIDYAHHPTEIKASINGIKSVYNRILYVFQPHTYSRTQALFQEFVSVLGSLPNIIMFTTYPAREKLILGGTAMDLYSALSNKDKYYFDDEKELMEFVDANHTSFDCVLILGAGDLADKLKRNYTNI